MKIESKTVMLYVALLLAGFGIGVLFYSNRESCDSALFKYINHELVCKDKMVVRKSNYVEFKRNMERFIQDKKKENKVTNVAIYFRDLQNGPTLGINEYEKFSPASLLKLPLFLAYLGLSIENDKLLETEIAFRGNTLAQEQYFKPSKSAENNIPYTINELLGFMIKYSDNNSYYVLLEYLGQISPDEDILKDTFIDLGIIDPKDFLEQTLTVKSYSAIFTQLYHNSFFTQKELSEKALSLLTESDFYQGIISGVPVDLKVANKFGERSLPNNIKQLHDCGIIYYPENPYLLCVMTQGRDFTELISVIREISKLVYDEFNSRKL